MMVGTQLPSSAVMILSNLLLSIKNCVDRSKVLAFICEKLLV